MTGLAPHKRDLLTLCLKHKILTFGTYTLKSGRQSPYFFNAGLFHSAPLLSTLASSYARTLASHDQQQQQQPLPSSSSSSSSSLDFDVLFGPAYKGIPLAASVLLRLHDLDATRYAGVGYAFDRKEAKEHGEGGAVVGASMRGKRVVVVDDVITAGTAVSSAVRLIEGLGGKVVGVVVALDREETVVGEEGYGTSTVEKVRRELGVPVLAVLTLGEVIRGLVEGGMVGEEELERLKEYRDRYGAKGS